MAERIITDDERYLLIEESSEDPAPDEPGGWTSTRIEWKPGFEPEGTGG